MRRKRYRADTKVWHDPLATPTGRKKAASKAAAEAEGEAERPRRRKVVQKRRDAKIVEAPEAEHDPAELERLRLLDRLLHAESRPTVTKAADAYFEAGYELPPEQAAWLQLLEHQDEERVTEAIVQLTALLDDKPPERRAVLESRLRRIEEFADEATTQSAAAELRRVLHRRYAETLDPSSA